MARGKDTLDALDALGHAGRVVTMLGDALCALEDCSSRPSPDTLGVLGTLAHDAAAELRGALDALEGGAS